MRCCQLILIIIIASVLMVSCPAGALSMGRSHSVTTSTAQDQLVELSIGNNGSSSVSSTSDYGSVTVTAGMTFNEISEATVSNLSAPAIDGFASNAYASATVGETGAFETTMADEIVYLVVAILGTNAVSSVSNSGTPLTWNQRGFATDGANESLETWYALAPTQCTIDVSVTFSSSTSFVATAFGIEGANAACPFDNNLASPTAGTGNGASQAISISTSNPNDLLIGAIAVAVPSGIAPEPSAGSGFTLISSTSNDTLGAAAECQSTFGVQSSASVNFSTSPDSVSWAMLSDAIQGVLPSATNDTGLSAPTSNGSFTLTGNSSAFLWSPSYPAAKTLYPGSWLLDLWASATVEESLAILFVAVNSSNAVVGVAAGGFTETIGTVKSQVQTNLSGSEIHVPSGGRLLAVLSHSEESGGDCTVYWGTGQVTNFRTPDDYDYVLRISNAASSSSSLSVSLYSSSSIGRLAGLQVSLYSPMTTQIVIANGTVNQSSGESVTLPAESTLYMSLSANANEFGSSSVIMSIRISQGARPFSCDVVALTVS